MISGLPGTGKSTYCRWLRDNYGYEFIEHDEFHCAVSGMAAAWRRIWEGQIQPAQFIKLRAGHLVVLEYGYPLDALHFSVLLQLTRDGSASAWWFDGDRQGAYENWSNRPTPLPELAWQNQTAAIEITWPTIAAIYRNRMVRTVGPSGPPLDAPAIDRLMFGA